MKRITIEQSQFYIPLQTEHIKPWTKICAFTLTPQEDGWEKVRYFGESILDEKGNVRPAEWIYILVNKLMPGIIKIGRTTTSVSQRVKEINSATGVIEKWHCVYKYKCVNSQYLEQEIHSYLQERSLRINPHREGFELDVQQAIDIINDLGEKYQIPFSPEG